MTRRSRLANLALAPPVLALAALAACGSRGAPAVEPFPETAARRALPGCRKPQGPRERARLEQARDSQGGFGVSSHSILTCCAGTRCYHRIYGEIQTGQAETAESDRSAAGRSGVRDAGNRGNGSRNAAALFRDEERGLMRADNRQAGELRPVEIVTGYLATAEGSALIKTGATQVLCAATVEDT